METAASMASEVLEVVDQIKPLLTGRHPGQQAAIVAELAGLWLAGHHPSCRDVAKAGLLELVDRLTAINAKKLWGS